MSRTFRRSHTFSTLQTIHTRLAAARRPDRHEIAPVKPAPPCAKDLPARSRQPDGHPA